MPDTTPDRLLNRKAVIEMVGFTSPTIYRKIAEGEFPKPIKIGRSARWSEHAIAAWIEAQKTSCQQAA